MDRSKEESYVWYGSKMENLDRLKTEWCSFGHYLLHKMGTEHATKILITDFASGRQYTGVQLKEKVLAVACALIDEYDFKPATVVTLAYDNSDYTIIMALAVLVAGGTVSSHYYKDPYTELLHMAKKVEPEFLFCHLRNLNWAKQLSTDLGFKVVAVSMDEPANETDSPPSGWFGDLFEYDYKTKSKSLDKLPVPTVKPLDQQAAMILMSSGTTGKPKAVAQTHWYCIADFAPQRRTILDSFSMACCVSLVYGSGRIMMFGCINSGRNAVIIEGFEPESILEATERYKLDVIALGAAVFHTVITHKNLDNYDISSVRCVYPFSAKSSNMDEMRQFFSKHPHIVSVLVGYGASEVSLISLNSITPKEYLVCPNDGRLLASLQAKIIDPDTGSPLGPTERGLLCVRSETLFPGYYDMEAARSRDRTIGAESPAGELSPFVWDEGVFDKEGYYITGDLVYFNSHDELHVIGRQKELIKTNDHRKVFPHVLEEIIGKHPIVASVCVLGIQSQLKPTIQCPRSMAGLSWDYVRQQDYINLLAPEKIENNERALFA